MQASTPRQSGSPEEVADDLQKTNLGNDVDFHIMPDIVSTTRYMELRQVELLL